MIGSLRGRLTDRGADEVLVEVAGVGYRVTVTPATVVAIGNLDDEVFLFIHHHLREDAQTLYGFPTRAERSCFEALIGAHGVGPALALAILSVHSPDSLRRTLADDDLASLCLVPGVGKKTAMRLLVELKSRLAVPDLDLSVVAPRTSVDQASVRADVREALIGLGYGPDEIREALADVPDEGDAALVLKDALRRVYATR
ncbi:MAG TPA: Holliday junction branch migration protein RuvA [Acidimicrobiales bacterium]|jgi:Holliday junction DNA helicase RuvA|nr:Holliday junction branch migration protein RuvA [Acidimicrobiales bacterium]